MRVYIGIGIVIISTVFFGWWGLLSLLFVFPFIGWKDRLKGPFFVQSKGTTDWEGGMNFNEKYPISSRLFQDLLVKISKNLYTKDSLRLELNEILQTLKDEDYADHSDSNKDVLIGFLNKFSALFPNWKLEYQIIFKTIKAHF